MNAKQRSFFVGILSQELYPSASNDDERNQHYIAASYVKFIEGSGARAAPILLVKLKIISSNFIFEIFIL